MSGLIKSLSRKMPVAFSTFWRNQTPRVSTFEAGTGRIRPLDRGEKNRGLIRSGAILLRGNSIFRDSFTASIGINHKLVLVKKRCRLTSYIYALPLSLNSFASGAHLVEKSHIENYNTFEKYSKNIFF